MFCKHCGKEITDDSRFCNHCGKSQDNGNKTVANYPIWIIYTVWALANLYLLTGDKGGYKAHAYEVFFPAIFDSTGWQPWDRKYYDFSEFIVYVFVVPAILYGIYKLICKRKADNSK